MSEFEDRDPTAAAVPAETDGKALEDSRAKAADYYDQLLRLRAEFDNFRKRSEREKAEARAWGKQEVLEPLVKLADVFEQAMAQVKTAKDIRQIVHGLEILHKNFSTFLKTEGVEPLDVIGKPFDPHTAEAVEQKEVPENQVGLVLDEVQKGYAFNGRILRPSRVRVGVARKSKDESNLE